MTKIKEWLKKTIVGIFEKWIVGVGIGLFLTFGGALAGSIKVFINMPEEVEAINLRITNDSIMAAKHLRDSVALYRGAVINLRNRVAEVENEVRKIKTKPKSKIK